MNTIILSDIHLGSNVSQAKLLCNFLHDIKIENVTERVIINGDLFEDANFSRLTKYHWKVLSIIRKLSDHVDVIYIRGNHDLPADLMSHLLGVKVVEDYEFVSGNKKILVLHGHIFDDFLTEHPVLVWIGDLIYSILQKIGHSIARLAKHNSKHYLRCADIIKQKAIKLAKRKMCDIVCCGHVHFAEVDTTNLIHYYNSGCWTELPCTYLEIKDGVITVIKYADKIP